MALDPQIKNIPLGDVEKAKVKEWLAVQIEHIHAVRSDLESSWSDWRRAAEGRPKASAKTFPWVGACNLEVPLIAVTANAITARLYNTIYGVDPLWSVRARPGADEEAIKLSEDVQDFMGEMAGEDEMNMPQFLRDGVLESVLMGVARCEIPYLIESATFREYDENYNVVERTRTSFAGVRPWFIPLEDWFEMPATPMQEYPEFQAHRFRRNWPTIQQRVDQQGWDRDEAEVMHQNPDADSPDEEERKRLEGYGIAHPAQEWELYKFDALMDWGHGLRRVMGIFHLKSKALIRFTYPIYFDHESRFEMIPFLPRAGRKSYRGLADMLYPLQEGLSTSLQQFIDNATIANTRIWKYRKNRQFGNKLEIWPGRAIALDDIGDLVGEQMGDVYNSGQMVMSIQREWAERWSGVADYQLGRESDIVKTRATATGTLAIVEEGNRLFDLETRDMRRALGRVGKKAFARYQQFKPDEKVMLAVGGKKSQNVRRAFIIPRENVFGPLVFDMMASTAQINRMVENQNLQALIPLTTQYYMQLGQAFVMYMKQQPGPMQELLHQEIQGSRELMARLFRTHEIRDIDELLPDIDEILEKFDKGGGRHLGVGQGAEAGADRGPGGESGVEDLFVSPQLGAVGAGSPTNGGGAERRVTSSDIIAGTA